MSVISIAKNEGNQFLTLVERTRTLLIRHPGLYAWMFSLLGWVLIYTNLSHTYRDVKRSSNVLIYCRPPLRPLMEGHAPVTNEPLGITSLALTTISDGFLPWIIMLVAMMFPLLNEPTKHTAFSVKRKDSYFVVLSFFIGYIIIWILAGSIFLLVPVFTEMLPVDQTHFVKALIKTSGFLLAAAVVWHPSRPVWMAKCSLTMPIRIGGWEMHVDALTYGWRTGFACLCICWAPMVALLLANHHAMLMIVVSIVLILERYQLPHTSKLPGYAWAMIALTVLVSEI